MLPIYSSNDKNFSLMQTQWSSQLNPLISQPLSQSVLLKNIQLVSGSNTINHRLGRKLEGWFITRMRGNFVQVYDLQDTNNMSNLTLIVNSSGSCLIDMQVF